MELEVKPRYVGLTWGEWKDLLGITDQNISGYQRMVKRVDDFDFRSYIVVNAETALRSIARVFMTISTETTSQITHEAFDMTIKQHLFHYMRLVFLEKEAVDRIFEVDINLTPQGDIWNKMVDFLITWDSVYQRKLALWRYGFDGPPNDILALYDPSQHIERDWLKKLKGRMGLRPVLSGSSVTDLMWRELSDRVYAGDLFAWPWIRKAKSEQVMWYDRAIDLCKQEIHWLQRMAYAGEDLLNCDHEFAGLVCHDHIWRIYVARLETLRSLNQELVKL
jgi:hypothetical protein